MAAETLSAIDASHETNELMTFATQQSWASVLMHEKESLDMHAEAKLVQAVQERLSGRPLAYIIGEWSFFGRRFFVNEQVLIPREDTEVLVRVACKIIREQKIQSVLDVCTGSGCVAITLALETNAAVSACDISAAALKIAHENAKQLNAPVYFFHSDLFGNNQTKADMIVSNPPYIPEKDRIILQREVRDFEPSIALFGGVDGLDFYRRIAKEAKTQLSHHGVIALEIGIGQADEVKDILIENDWHDIEFEVDLAGIIRVIHATL